MPKISYWIIYDYSKRLHNPLVGVGGGIVKTLQKIPWGGDLKIRLRNLSMVPYTYYVILFTVKRFRRVTFFLVNRVKHKKLRLSFWFSNRPSADTVTN